MSVRMWRKGNLWALLIEMYIHATIWENYEVSSKKLLLKFCVIQQYHTLIAASKGNDNRISQRCMHSYVHCSVIHNSEDTETTYVSINEWMNKEVAVSIQTMDILWFSHEKKGNPAIYSNWRELEGIVLSEISQIKTDITFCWCLVELRTSRCSSWN